MPGCDVSAKRLGDIRLNFDAPRHNSTPLLREHKKWTALQRATTLFDQRESASDRSGVTRGLRGRIEADRFSGRRQRR